jgi:hypothetical protein
MGRFMDHTLAAMLPLLLLLLPLPLLCISLTERGMDPDGGWGAALAHHYARKVTQQASIRQCTAVNCI